MDQISEFGGGELIGGLVDLIEHESKKGGFMDLNAREWRKHQTNIRHVIGLLE